MAAEIDLESKHVTVDGVVTKLTDRQAAVLAVLASGRVVTRSDLIEQAGLDGLSERRCEGIILDLRQILGPDSIANLRKRGWRLLIADAVISA